MSTSYQVTINDASPLWQYNTGGWSQCFDQSGCTPSAVGASGVGESYHGANASGATATLSFSGSSVQLYGEYDGSSGGTVIIDGSAVPIPYQGSGLDTLIANGTGLSQSTSHSLQVQTTGAFNLTSAVVSVTGSQALSNYSVPFWDTSIQYSGTWMNATVQGLPNGTTRTTDQGAIATLTFNGVGVVVYSSLNNGHGAYNMTLDGTASHTLRRASSGSSRRLLSTTPPTSNRARTRW